MRFNFTDTQDTRAGYAFAGSLGITAENQKEVGDLIDHFRLFKDAKNPDVLAARIKALQSDTLTHTIGTTKRPAFEVETCLDYEFTAPYAEWMERTLGYGGALPDLELPRKWGGLMYTHYKARLFLEGGHICFLAYTESQPWNGKDAQTYAESSVVDYIAEEYGTRRREPEMIEYRPGQFKRNPNYLKRHGATPAASNASLKRALFEWWRDNHATPRQLEVIEGNAQIVAETGDYMDAFRFKGHESRIYWGRKVNEAGVSDYKAMSYREFAELGSEAFA